MHVQAAAPFLLEHSALDPHGDGAQGSGLWVIWGGAEMREKNLVEISYIVEAEIKVSKKVLSLDSLKFIFPNQSFVLITFFCTTN